MAPIDAGTTAPVLAVASSLLPRIRRNLFGIAPVEASFLRRGFAVAEAMRQQRLERIARTFIEGYNTAVERANPTAVASHLASIADEFQGFAYEGAAMGFALLDLLTPWRGQRFVRFLEAANSHIYMIYVGAGWALARTSHRLAWRLGPLDPLLRWLVLDGHGFHDGFFHPRDTIDRQDRPRGLHGYAQNAYDQGLGRAIWFARGANVGAVAATLDRFAPDRLADLWSGIGLAAAYAGGAAPQELSELREMAGMYRTHLGQGAVFAAKARERAGNPAQHTDLACQFFYRLDARGAAAIADSALSDLVPSNAMWGYEAWRAQIRSQIAGLIGTERP